VFDPKSERSVDWQTYPIVEMQDAPEAIDVVLINHPDQAPGGAGEAVCRPVAGAIANVLFDALACGCAAARVKSALG
jgi:nicotinate dehydrogenase subunit B